MDTAAIIHRIGKPDSNLLGVSCALGNFDYKLNAGLPPSRQAVVCTPNVPVQECTYNEDLYLILACGGIWEVMSNEGMGRFMAGRIKELQQDSSNNDDDNKFPRGGVLAGWGTNC